MPCSSKTSEKNVRVPQLCQVGNRLSRDDCHIIARLCEECAIDEEVAIVAADAQEQMIVDEVFAAVFDQELVVEVPVVLDEDVVAIEEEPYHPYQLTHYYQCELVQFQEAFEERGWMNNMNDCNNNNNFTMRL